MGILPGGAGQIEPGLVGAATAVWEASVGHGKEGTRGGGAGHDDDQKERGAAINREAQKVSPLSRLQNWEVRMKNENPNSGELYIRLRDGRMRKTRTLIDQRDTILTVDLDEKNRILGIEILAWDLDFEVKVMARKVKC